MSMLHMGFRKGPCPCRSQPKVSAINLAFNIMVLYSQPLSESTFDTHLFIEIGIDIRSTTCHRMNRKKKKKKPLVPSVPFPQCYPFFLLSLLYLKSQKLSPKTHSHKTTALIVSSEISDYMLFAF